MSIPDLVQVLLVLVVLAIVAAVTYVAVIRPWANRWGASQAEIGASMPYEEMVPHPKAVATRAITIHAAVEQVWPWFAQLGCDRAGWYSYDLLDNGGKKSADRILPEFQNIKVGDPIGMIPGGKMSMPVSRLDPGRLMVLGGTIDTSTGKGGDINDPNLKSYFAWTITIQLVPVDGNTTRLVIRNRSDWNPTLMNNIVNGYVINLMSFIMEQRMMVGVKQRAEKLNRVSMATAGN